MSLVTDPVTDTVTDPTTDPPSDPGADAQPEDAGAPARKTKSRPLYWRLLRLRHVHPNGWQRALLGEGAIAVAVILVLADRASAWALLILPLTVAAVVKAHDVLAGLLAPVPSVPVPAYDDDARDAAGETTTAPPEGDAVVEDAAT
jgi:hypothetical protein